MTDIRVTQADLVVEFHKTLLLVLRATIETNRRLADIHERLTEISSNTYDVRRSYD